MKALSGDFGAQAVIPSAPVAGRETSPRAPSPFNPEAHLKRVRYRLDFDLRVCCAFPKTGREAAVSAKPTLPAGFAGKGRSSKSQIPNVWARRGRPRGGKNGAFGESALGKSQPSLKTALHRITALRLDLVRTLDIASLRVTPSLIA